MNRKFYRSLIAMILIVASILSLTAGAFAQETEDAVYREEFISREEAEEIVDETDYALEFDSERENPYDMSPILEDAGIDPHPERKPATRTGAGGNWEEFLFVDFLPLSPERDWGWYVNSWQVSPEQPVRWSEIEQGRMECYFSGYNANVQSQMVVGPNNEKFTIPENSVVWVNVQIDDSKVNGVEDYFGITENGTATMSCSVCLYFEDDPSVEINGSLVYKTGDQLLRFSSADLTAAGVSGNNVLKSIRFDFLNLTAAPGSTVKVGTGEMASTIGDNYITGYIEHIYIGPEEKKPLKVQFYDDTKTYITDTTFYVPYGCGVSYNNIQGNIKGTQAGANEVWGWKETYGASFTETGNFYLDPIDAGVTHNDTRFILTKLSLPADMDVGSTKKLTSGSDLDDDDFTLTIDAVSTAKISEAHYTTPQDFTIVLDRSGSMAGYASTSDEEKWTVEKDNADDLKHVIEALDTTKFPGYYRATIWVEHGAGTTHNTYNSSGKLANRAYGAPLRYMYGKWYMPVQTQVVRYIENGTVKVKTCDGCVVKNSNGTVSRYLRAHGIRVDIDAAPCKCVTWVELTLENIDTYFYDRRGLSQTYPDPNDKSQTITVNRTSFKFEVYVSRYGKSVEAIEDFLDALYASNKNLKPGEYHTVSILSYGAGIYTKGYPYVYNNSTTDPKYKKTDYNYSGCTCESQALNASGYSKLINTARGLYLLGATRTDAAFKALANNNDTSGSYEDKGMSQIEIQAGFISPVLDKTKYLPAKKTGRNRTVVLLTDGCPTENAWTGNIPVGTLFSPLTAAICIRSARVLKDDGVKIYTLGYIEGLTSVSDYSGTNMLDRTDKYEEQQANDFLQLMSSNYPGSWATYSIKTVKIKVGGKDVEKTVPNLATGFAANAAGSSTQYYMVADSAGSDLGNKFTSIMTGEVPEIELSQAGTLYIYDEITREYKLDPKRPIRIYAKPYNGDGTYGDDILLSSYAIAPDGSPQTYATDIFAISCTPRADGELTTVTLKWTDCKKAYLRNTNMPTGSAVASTPFGYKIVLELPIAVDRKNTLGGNQIPTNTSKSGLYPSNKADTAMGTESIVKYEVPKANVSPRYEFRIHDYFLELPTMATIYKKGLNTSGEIFEAMTSSDVTLVNGNDRSRLDYLNLDIVVKTTDGKEVYRSSASAGAKVFTEKVSALESAFDFTTDQPMEVYYTVSHKYSGKDSVDREQYNTVYSDPLTANYYAPKFMVVDFDAEGSVSLQREVDAERLSFTATNGGYDSSTGHVKFDFRETYGSEEARKMMDGWVTIPYTFDSINVPKDGVDVRSRQVYVLPGNVISYDDTLFGFHAEAVVDKTATEPVVGKWVRLGTYGNDVQLPESKQAHGYDKNFATTGDYHGASTVARVGATNPDVAPMVFEFYGTGFELLSRTAPDSGTVVVEIFKAKADGTYGVVADKGYLVDTYLANKTLYQIPVVQFLSGEAPAKYKVHVIPVYDMIFDHGKKGFAPITEDRARAVAGFDETVDFTFVPSPSVAPATRAYEPMGAYNVYVDGCRVYNTLTADAQGIRDYIYSLAGEQDANILNINDRIVDVSMKVNWTNNTEISGMLFIEAPKMTNSDVEGDTGSDETITNTTHGYCLGMNGSLNEEADPGDNNKFYVRTPELEYITHDEYGTRIYYRLSPMGRTLFYCTDSKNAEVPLTEAEIRKYVGNGEEIVYYSSAYKAIGPAKEVYLSKDQGVAFKVDSDDARVFMSMKTVDGKAVTVQAYKGSAFVTIPLLTDYRSDTEMYFDLTDYVNDGTVMIKNAGPGILSLCNLKTASAEGSLHPFVDSRMIRLAMKAFGGEAELPAVDENVVIRHSLNLQSDISVNLIVPAAALEGYDRYVMECTAAGKTFYPAAEVKNGMVYFTVDGLMATQMNENIHSVLHLIKGDETFTSVEDDYSIACYAYTTLNKPEATDSIKTLCANLLRYGSLAQLYKNYQTDALADEEMTEIHKSYLTDTDTVAFGSNNRLLGDVAEPAITWSGKSMILDSKVTVVYVLNTNGYEGSLEDLRLRVTYEAIDGTTTELELEDLQVYNEATGLYSFKLDTLLAAELRAVVSATVYSGETQVSETLCYSADTYGNGKTGTLAELCKALFAYSDSARAFFAN